MTELIASPWRRYIVQTLGLWAGCCVLMMMLLDSGRGVAFYAIGSGLFWGAAAAGSFLRPKPSQIEIGVYRIGPLIVFVFVFVVSSLVA
jgi:hypothetical protein